MRALILAVLLTATCGAQAQAQVHKCTDAAGRKYYQDRPCTGDQRASQFDPAAGNVTTIDSETVRHQTQGALLTREESRERRVETVAPGSADTRVTISGPDGEEPPAYDGPGPYPVYHDDGRRHDRGRGDRDRHSYRDRRRPDETPMQDSAGRNGSNYVPTPPTIRQVAPRSPASPSARGTGSRAGAGREDDRDGGP